MTSRRSVLFVCLGNICRSRTAEGVMNHLVGESDLGGQVEVDSAGTGDYHVGEDADPRMRAAAEPRGYVLGGEARQIVSGDFEHFDLILAMDRSNLRDLERLAGGGRPGQIRLLSEFLPDGEPIDVPDPYYEGNFDGVVDLIEQACPVILDHLLE